MGDGLAADEVEIEIGHSPLKVGLGLVGVVAVVVALVTGFGGGTSTTEPAKSDRDFGDGPFTTHEQMSTDQSNGIALEVVGDELWILGGGSVEAVDGPFKIYVTGPEGELLRTIELGQHFDVMGQSESYVWLLADGLGAEETPEMRRFSKDSGDVTSSVWLTRGGPVNGAVFTDDGFWFSVEDGSFVEKWDFASNKIVDVASAPSALRPYDSREGFVYLGSEGGWLYRVREDGGTYEQRVMSADGLRVVDMVLSGDEVWALDEAGIVRTVRTNLKSTTQGRCIGATHLAALPGGGVLAIRDFETCEIKIDERSTDFIVSKGEWEVHDSVVFAGQLWSATSYLADHVSTPIDVAAETTQEQMAKDRSDGVALEVVGDELWILGSGVGDAAAGEPFSIYVTGAEGELLRTINVGRHFNAMGQSESYVWLLADGTRSEVVALEPEVMRIAKDTGEIVRKPWSNIYGQVDSVAFSDNTLWATFANGLAHYWSSTGSALVSSNVHGDGEQLLRHDGILYEAATSRLSRTDDFGRQGTMFFERDISVIDMAVSGDELWVLSEDGVISVADAGLELASKGRCTGATQLASLPGGSVVASAGSDFCVVGQDYGEPTTLEPGIWPVSDTAVFSGRLWLATSFEAQSISVPIDAAEVTASSSPERDAYETTREQMFFERSDAVDMEVVGDELWILGNGVFDINTGTPSKIYVTGPQGELLRTIGLESRFDVIGQSDSYVWLLSYVHSSEPADPDGHIKRISKATGEIENGHMSLTRRFAVAFTDDGFLYEYPRGVEVLLGFWDVSEQSARRVAALSEHSNGLRSSVIRSIVTDGQDVVFAPYDGWMYRISPGGDVAGVQLPNPDLEIFDMAKSGESFWVLQRTGLLTSFDANFETVTEGRCPGAFYLRPLPAGHVAAISVSDSCTVLIDGTTVTTPVLPSLRRANDTIFFAGKLWYATDYLDTGISVQNP